MIAKKLINSFSEDFSTLFILVNDGVIYQVKNFVFDENGIEGEYRVVKYSSGRIPSNEKEFNWRGRFLFPTYYNMTRMYNGHSAYNSDGAVKQVIFV